nr:AraC family transcriptional regulator [Lysinibacillus timonensis]
MKGKPLLQQYVNVVGGYRYHWHESIEIQLIVTGECEICIDGAKYNLVPNDLILVNAGCGHATLRHKGECFSIVTHVSPEYLNLLGLNPDIIWLHCNSAEDSLSNSPIFQSLRDKLCRCLLALKSDTPSATIAARGYFELFLATLIDKYPPEALDRSQRKKNNEFIQTIIKFIERNYRKKLSLDEVARFAGYNRSYFSAFFKNSMGIGFYEYLTRCRLQSATIDLMESDKSISDIALRNGFSDVKSFNQAFRRNFHISPNEYRKSVKKPFPTPNTLNRMIVEEDNPVVCRYLEQYREKAEQGNSIPTTHALQEITLSLRADETITELLSQFVQAGIEISLDVKKTRNTK